MTRSAVSGARIAGAAITLLLSGAVSASAEDKPKAAAKPSAEKMACGGKNSCGNGMDQDMEKSMDKAKSETSAHPVAPGEHKSGDAK